MTRTRSALLTALLMAAAAAPALAQTSPTFDSTSTSTTQSFLTDSATLPGGERASTTMLGILPGSGTVGTFTVPERFGSAASNGAVTSAGNAVSLAASPVRVRLSDPALLSRSAQSGVVFGTPTITTTTTTGAVTTQVVTNIASGTTYDAGALGVCASAGTSGSIDAGGALPSGCATGTPVTVPISAAGTNTNTNTAQIVRTTTTTTIGSTLDETYAVTGTPIVQLGTSHALTRIGAIDDVSRLMRRGLDEAMDPQPIPGAPGWVGFVEGYGGFGRTATNGLVPGTRSEFGGFTGGLGTVALPGLTLGWMVDHARSAMRTTNSFAPEDSMLDLTKTGPYGSFRLGDLNIGFLGALGQGNTNTRNGSEAAGGVARAGYDVRVATGGFQFDYNLSRWLDVKFSPQFGYQYARVSTDGFTETGSPFALQGLSGDSTVNQYWLGVIYNDTVQIGPLRMEARGYARFTQASGDTDGAAAVILASNPGSAPMRVGGSGQGDSAAEFGLRLRVPLLIGNVQLAYDGRASGAGSTNVFSARARFEF